MSNLINSLKLGRNTSLDLEFDPLITRGPDSYSELGKRGIVFVMDNAPIHHARILKNFYKKIFNICF